MEENNINEEIEEEAVEAPMTRKHYTKQQNVTYTIISIVLFFILYFAVKGIMGTINRPYHILVYSDQIAESTAGDAFAVSGISAEQGYVFENARLNKDVSGYALNIIFSGIKDEESFAESGMTFEYGDVEEDIRREFYPYRDNSDYAEYVYADKYVNIDYPAGAVYLFEWEGELYAEYSEYSTSMPGQISGIFAGQEKIYIDS